MAVALACEDFGGPYAACADARAETIDVVVEFRGRDEGSKEGSCCWNTPVLAIYRCISAAWVA